MFLFIAVATWSAYGDSIISIHLMFLFILKGQSEVISIAFHFNTSHVLIYLYADNEGHIFICYFNTSHVLIYRRKSNRIRHSSEFQYISCSYLSLCLRHNLHMPNLFQYISCSYLSNAFTPFSFYIIRNFP